MTKLHYIKYTQPLNISLDEAWNFFSSPDNLKHITPPKMGFQIISKHPSNKMFAGMIIQYIVKPLFGIPMRWVTEITHVKDKEYFIDEQRFGPYKFWHHLHQFKIENGKLIMEDHLHYALPFGILGRIANSLFVSKEIAKIFFHREVVITRLFNNPINNT